MTRKVSDSAARTKRSAPRKERPGEVPEHVAKELARKKWKSSGLTDTDASVLGLEAIVDGKHPRLRIPYRDVNAQPAAIEGKLKGFAATLCRDRFLEDEARDILAPLDPKRPGHRLRYVSPKDAPPCVYYPHGILKQPWAQIVSGPATTIYVVEGELKAAAGCKTGLPTVGIGGVWNISSKKHKVRLLPDLEAIVVGGHTVVIVFDNDVASKPNVRAARQRFRDALREHGCSTVRVVEMPAGPAKGLDDYLVANGPAATRILMEGGRPADEVDPPRRATIATIVDALKGNWGIRAEVALLSAPLELNLLKNEVVAGRRPLDIESAVFRFREAAARHELTFPKNDTWDALIAEAKEHAYHPVASYLTDLPDWDRKEDWIEQAAAQVLRLPADDRLSRILWQRFLIAAVARAMTPGCKADCVLVLVGRQGVKKSTLFEELAGGPEFFGDTPVNLRDKDSYLALHQTWFYEWGELETKRRAASAASVKAFITARHDLIRPPYGRTTENMPRSCVIVGTTNDDHFLDDPTGSRRFWPVPVPDVLNIEWLREHRDALWAQAVALYRAREPWWIEDGSDEEKLLVSRHEAHREVDPFEDGAVAFVEASREQGGPTSDEILQHLFRGEGAYIGRKDLYQRVAAALKAKGYACRRWTVRRVKDSQLRWRHKSWGLPTRGNPKLKGAATVTPLPTRSACKF